MSCGCRASLLFESDRADLWKRVLGTTEVPIRYPLYRSMDHYPGKRFLMADTSSLTPDQSQRLIRELSSKFNIAEGEIQIDGGVPILDEGIAVIFCTRHSMGMV